MGFAAGNAEELSRRWRRTRAASGAGCCAGHCGGRIRHGGDRPERARRIAGQRATFIVRETAAPRSSTSNCGPAQDGSAEMDGRTWVRKKARLPLRLPLGYHEISARVGQASAKTR